MPTSSRFAVAVHILTALAMRKSEPITSETIAKSASTNPAVIRRLLSMLNDAGISRAQLGQGGGALLARAPEDISLLDVYRAVEREALFALHRTEPCQDCMVGRNIQAVLNVTLDRALQALESELAKVSIADMARNIGRRSRAHPAPMTRNRPAPS